MDIAETENHPFLLAGVEPVIEVWLPDRSKE